MVCQDFQDLLQRRLDGEPVAELVGYREHVLTCGDCRALQQAAELLLEQVSLQPVTAPPAALTSRIVGRVTADRKNQLMRRRRTRLRLGRYLAVAASVLLAILAGVYGLPWLRSPASKDGPPVVRINPAPHAPPAAAPSMEHAVSEARQAVASLTDKGAVQVRALLAVANPMENAGVALPAIDMQPAIEPTALRQTGQGAAEGLQTVASSTQRAFAFFFRELVPPASAN